MVLYTNPKRKDEIMIKRVDYQELANADVMNGASSRNVHDNLKHHTVEELREINDSDRLPFGVAIVNVTGELNIGTIVRNALLTGAHKVGVIGRRKYDKRGTVGSEHYINVERIDALEDNGIDIRSDVFWQWMDDNCFYPVFVEQGGLMLNNVDWRRFVYIADPWQLCFVFGNENRGIPDYLLNDSHNHFVVSIEQRGVIRSFNVGSASAIVLHDFSSAIS
jgi:tRNA G18 (ribose-2'-O)-methylase SpoU